MVNSNDTRLRKRDLAKKDTNFAEVKAFYIAPRLAELGNYQPSRVKVWIFMVLGALALIVNIIIANSKWGLNIPLILASVIGLAAFLYSPIVNVWVRALLVFVISHYPFPFFAGGAVLTFVLALILGNALLGVLCFLFIVGLVFASLATLFGKKERETVTVEPEIVVEGSDYVKQVYSRLPAALVDYYAPKSNYRPTYPSRSEFNSIDEYTASVKEIDDETYAQRISEASTFIEGVEDDPKNDGVVLAKLRVANGSYDDELLKRANMLDAAIGAYGVEKWDYDDRAGFVGFRINVTRQPTAIEKLQAIKTAPDFFITHRIDSHTSYVAGVDQDGNDVFLPRGHSLVFGTTGAGKGSTFRARVVANAPLVQTGHLVQYVCDPKIGEAKAFRKASQLFRRIETKAPQMADIVDEVYDILKRRQDAEDDWEPTVDSPAIDLFVDELPSLMKDKVFINRKDPELNGMTTADKLFIILAQGRSDGVSVVAATQFYTKKVLDDLRDNFIVRSALRTETPSQAAAFLGEDPAGFKAIPVATKDNGYRSAGIGYIKLDGGTGVQAIRYGYMSNEDFVALGKTYAPSQEVLDHFEKIVHPTKEQLKAQERKQLTPEELAQREFDELNF